MMLITRNGKTTVVSGWRVWLIGAAILMLGLSVLIGIGMVLIAAALSLGVLLLVAVPALGIAGWIKRVTHRGL